MPFNINNDPDPDEAFWGDDDLFRSDDQLAKDERTFTAQGLTFDLVPPTEGPDNRSDGLHTRENPASSDISSANRQALEPQRRLAGLKAGLPNGVRPTPKQFERYKEAMAVAPRDRAAFEATLSAKEAAKDLATRADKAFKADWTPHKYGQVPVESMDRDGNPIAPNEDENDLPLVPNKRFSDMNIPTGRVDEKGNTIPNRRIRIQVETERTEDVR
jgi:hypothetical protein